MRDKTAAAVFTVTALWSAAASAHTAGPEGGALTPLASSAAVGFVLSHASVGLVALAAAALLVAALCDRKALGTALVALTFWITFQGAVHSVHHLGHPSDEARCVVASSAAQTSAIPTEVHASVSNLPMQATLALDFAVAAHRGGLPATHEGRAPPRLTL